MACEYAAICNKALVLQRIRDNAGLTAAEYPVSALKVELCDSPDSAQRDVDCFAIPDIRVKGPASDFVK